MVSKTKQVETVSFRNAENRDLACRATATLAFTFAAEIGSIYSHLAAQKLLGIGRMVPVSANSATGPGSTRPAAR